MDPLLNGYCFACLPKGDTPRVIRLECVKAQEHRPVGAFISHEHHGSATPPVKMCGNCGTLVVPVG